MTETLHQQIFSVRRIQKNKRNKTDTLTKESRNTGIYNKLNDSHVSGKYTGRLQCL